ncbi:MAG: protein phosphatase 2C domain-containing protein, partial [Brachymonas sp.]|nr:protein phosphatase 2C domain-containing protein [Brachymonas sp.]
DRGLPDTPRTTLVAVLVQNGHAVWVHCGDSRLYVVRDGKLLLRTRDHSYLEQGEHFNTSKMEGINRNVLFTCLGSPSRPIFDVSLPMVLKQKDRILLCSDGLWGNLEDEEIVRHVGDLQRPLAEELPQMVDEALRRGGPNCDNTTVIAMSWDMPSVKDGPEVVTDSILDGVFASTIQSYWDKEEGEELNDDEIERSIAEINAAINRITPGRKP